MILGGLHYIMRSVMNAVKIAKCLSGPVAINPYIAAIALREKAEGRAEGLIEGIRADFHKAI